MNATAAYYEKALLQQVAEGNELAFGSLFDLWRNKLYFYILRITNSAETTEDVIQDVFLKIWLNRTGLHEVENFGAYLYSMARNWVITCMRRMAQETMILAELRHNAVTSGRPIDEALFHKQMQEKLNEIIANLPQQQRLVYTLSREQGLAQQEIARQLNITISTVQNHMNYALRNIRNQFRQYYPEESCFIIIAIACLVCE